MSKDEKEAAEARAKQRCQAAYEKRFMDSFKLAAAVIDVRIRNFGRVKAAKFCIYDLMERKAPAQILDSLATAFGN